MKFVTNLSKGILGSPDVDALWGEIISHIPDEVLLRPDVTILNIASGHCTEAVILAKRMIALGISKERVKKAFYLVDKYRVFTNYAKSTYGFENVFTADFLEWITEMRFDVVIGNPPFQGNGNNGSHGKWQKFFITAVDLAKEDGHICLITPHWHNWACPSSEPLGISKNGEVYERSSGKDYKIFASGKVEKLALIDGKGYFDQGSTFCWTYYRKDKADTISSVVFSDGEQSQFDFTSACGLPSILDKTSLGIYQKIFLHGSFEFFMDHQTINITSDNYRDIPDNEYMYKWIYSAGSEGIRYRWIKEKSNNYHKFKVLIPISAGCNGYKYASVQTDCNQSHDLPMVLFDTQQEAEQFIAYLKIPIVDGLFRMSTGTTKHGKIILPKIDITRRWTDTELCRYWNFTDEERLYIEKRIK